MSDYEQKLEDFYSRILRPGDIAIDVGAHSGRHTLPMMTSVGAEGAIFAFEPIPHIRRTLEQRIAGHQHASIVHSHSCALADAPGEAVFEVVNEFPEYSGLRERRYDGNVTRTQIQVVIDTLDRVLPVDIGVRFIKVDCEGAELLVLRGGEETLRRCRPYIAIESGDGSLLHYPYDAGDIHDFLARRGYSVFNLAGKRHSREEFVNANSVQAYWDYIAVPNEFVDEYATVVTQSISCTTSSATGAASGCST